MLEISYILYKKKEYYTIKEDAKNKPKSKLSNSENLDCCKQILPHENEKKRKKSRKIYDKQIANEELKKNIQLPKNLLKNST